MKRIFLLLATICLMVSCSENLEDIPPTEHYNPVTTVINELKKDYNLVDYYSPTQHNDIKYIYPSESKDDALFCGIKENKLKLFFYEPTYDGEEKNELVKLTFKSDIQTAIEVPMEEYAGYGNNIVLFACGLDDFHKYNSTTSFILKTIYTPEDNPNVQYKEKRLIILHEDVVTLDKVITNKNFENYYGILYYYKDYIYVYKEDMMDNILECYSPSGEQVGEYRLYPREEMWNDLYWDTYHSYLKTYIDYKTGIPTLTKNEFGTNTERSDSQNIWTLPLKEVKEKEKVEIKYLKFDGVIWEFQLDSIFWDGTKEQKTVKVDVTKGEIVK